MIKTSSDDAGYLAISGVEISYTLQASDLMLYDAAAADNSGSYATLQYSVRFVPEQGDYEYQSGNPGYISDYPLIF